MSGPRIGQRPAGLFGRVVEPVAARVSGTRSMHLFGVLSHHPGLFRGWLMFAGRLMPRGKLPRRDTETVILRVAHLRGCAYEYEHHVTIGKRFGIGPAELARIEAGPDAAGLSPADALLLRAVDELHATQDLSDDTWSQLRGRYDERRLIELVMLVAHYEMLATTIGTLRIETDAKR